MTKQEAEEFLEKKVAEIAEHFDCVQIMASTQVPEGTVCVKRGAGNWYGRQGMAHEFIEANTAQEHACELARRLNPDS